MADTCAAVSVGGSAVSRHPATGGTPAANAVAVKPSMNKNRSSERSSATRPLAEPTASR